MDILIIVLIAVFALVALALTGLRNKLDSLTYQILQLQTRVRRMEKKEENR